MEKRNENVEFSASPYAHDDDNDDHNDDDEDEEQHVDGSREILASESGSEEIIISGKSLGGGYERVSEIEELRREEEEEEIKIDHQFDDVGRVVVQEDIVCVVIYDDVDGTTDGSTSKNVSMDALLWTLSSGGGGASSSSSSSLFLLHVYPPLRFIPTPLGKLPISQANEEQRNIHLAKERTRRLESLQPFLHLCSTSHPPVSADVIPIQGDNYYKEANSILELISALQIKRLVLGIHPSSSSSSSITTPKKQGRRQLGGGGGGISGVAGRILENAPQFCEVNIICQGKQQQQQLLLLPFTAASSATATTNSNINIIKRIRSINNYNPTTPPHPHPHPHPHSQQQQLPQSTSSLGYCKCFKPKTIS